uniref:Uncharacterized protein n=1 Tax=Meloidogyne javanica TaxID=6303 RepID=A0A915LH76_MELJA
MSPPILRKEMEQDWGDVEKDSNNVDVFVRMPKLEPEKEVNNCNVLGKEEVEMKPKRKYVRRKVKDLEEGKEVKEEMEEKLIKKRRRKNLPKEDNLEKEIKEEIKEEIKDIKEEIREKEEENIIEKENKLGKRKKLENGRVLSIHYEPTERSLLLTLLWFYTGKQLPSLRLNNSGCSNFEDNELLASKHLDIVNADSVQGTTRVLTFSAYCRYKAQLALERLPAARRPPNWAHPCPRFKQNMEEEEVNDIMNDSNCTTQDTV